MTDNCFGATDKTGSSFEQIGVSRPILRLCSGFRLLPAALAVFAIAFGFAMSAPDRAIAQTAAEKRARIKAANDKKKAEAAAKKKAEAGERQQATAKAQKESAKKKPQDWHVGEPVPTDDFGGGFTLQKNYDPEKSERERKELEQPAEPGTYLYLKQQVWEIKRGQRPGGYTRPNIEKRLQAIDKLKKLGPAAADAIPALAWSATDERDASVRRGAIDILGDIGGMLGVVAVSGTLLQPDKDPETAKVAEESLLRLLPVVGSSLTMNDAIFLSMVHNSGNERISPAIESAWAASGITQDDIAKEIERRNPAPVVEEVADKKRDRAVSKIQKLCQKILYPDDDPAAAKTAEDLLLKILTASGARITPRDGFFLYDVRRLGNRHLARAIENVWELNGFTQYFMAKEKLDREQPGHEEARAKAYAATHHGRKQLHVKDMPEAWARFMMTPDPPAPDFGYWFNRVSAMSAAAAAEDRRAEIDRRNRERAANRAL